MDFFALLHQPRRPWLETEHLKEALHEAAARHHPDRGGDSRRFANINAAHACLSRPSTRLKHLVELQWPDLLARPFAVPPPLAETFMCIATLRRAADAFVNQQAGASTPLGQALLAPERFALARDMERELAQLQSSYDLALDHLRLLDGKWDDAASELGSDLHTTQQELAFLEKWMEQLRESLFRVQN